MTTVWRFVAALVGLTVVVFALRSDDESSVPREPEALVVRDVLESSRAAPAASHPKPSVGALEVLVQWRDDGAPIPGVWVTLGSLDDAPTRIEPRSLRTNADGLVRFDDVPPGDVELECDRGLRDFGLVQTGKTRRKSLRLERGVTVAGRVLDAAGEPIAGAEIWLTRDSDFIDGFPAATSAVDGTYSIEGVVSAERYVGAREPRHAPSGSHHVYASSGSTLELELVLGGPSGAVAGRVLDVNGAPIEGARVVVGPKDAPELVRSGGATSFTPDGCATTSAGDGAFELSGLLAGPSWIEASARGFLAVAARIEIPAGECVSGDLVLGRGATLTGVVQASNGGPARFALVTVRSNADHETHTARTELDGTFRFEGLRPGEAKLHAEWGDQEWRDEIRELWAGETVWNPVLERGRDVVGRVLAPDGGPAIGLRVVVERSIRGDEPFLRAATTDFDGRFRVRGCGEREHVLRIFPADSELFPWLETSIRPSEAELELRLDAASRPSVRIVGRIVAADGAIPAGATVLAFNRVLDYAAHELALPDGSFSIGPLPSGAWGVVIESEGFASVGEPTRRLEHDEVWDLGRVFLPRGDPLTVEFELPSGVVRDPLLVVEGLDSPVREWLSVEGRVARSKPLAAGRYRVSVEGAGLAAELHDVEVVAGRDATLVLSLRAGVDVLLRTREAEKPGVLRVFAASRGIVVERSFVSELALCLAPGSYRCEADYDDGRRAAAAFDVVAGATNATVDVTLE
jgi:hypothetical protein